MDTVVIPVNLRAFSPDRIYRPEYQFVRERLYLENNSRAFRAYFRPLANWKAFDLNPVSQDSFDQRIAYDDETPIGTMQEIAERLQSEGPADHIRANYFYPLPDDHPQLLALSAIQDLCAEHSIRLLAYITPLDISTGEEFLPGTFQSRIENNVRICTRLSPVSTEIMQCLIFRDFDQVGLRYYFHWAEFADNKFDDVGRQPIWRWGGP